ncbi:AbrB family transcriptional regulator [Paragemmobacter ruber]|uniref:AbrB family transcriptional regulator n=1 Tax=Paragemmobacter ruber TaxID=1985673 RepID=A0ABW9Y3R0_9RHOB|nr:AbrB family transcriptional regulator [Rhodobacter ruber]NBE07170.1 AbrB family transcriptional regulator [Rhodobacter ruber]
MTLGIALLGAGLFHLAGLPLPFLFGPMLACLLVALMGAPLRGMGPLSKAARTILGVAVGASITPEVVERIPQMAGSVALVPVYVAAIGAVGYPFFRRLGHDPATAWFAAMPGGLSDMLAFGQEAGGDVRALALIHATRVLMIVTLAPLILVFLYGASLSGAIGEPARDIPLSELALMGVAAVVGWKGAERAGLFGAAILGPMIAAAVLSLTGLIHARPPTEAILVAQLFIGLGVGVQYVGVTLRELRGYVLSGLAFVAVLAVLAALFTEIAVLSGLAAPVEGFLAFAPGGQAEMTVLALVAGADLGFVILHHLVRIVTVIVGAPLVRRVLRANGRGR